jgi:hypothetical protein
VILRFVEEMIVRSVELKCLNFLESRWCRLIVLGVSLCLVFGSSPGVEARSIPSTRPQNPQSSTKNSSPNCETAASAEPLIQPSGAEKYQNVDSHIEVSQGGCSRSAPQDTLQQDTSSNPGAPASDGESSEKVATPSEDAGKPAESHPETPESELEHALEEYKVQIGRVTMALSGAADANGSLHFTKDYHGNFFEYLRNDALDALPHQVRQAAGTKSILRRNQFGFNLTGPLKIPWLWHGDGKTFFSVTYEGTREKLARSRLYDIPTAQQRSGDFSDLVDNAGQPITIYDPLTTRPSPNFDPAQPVSLSNLEYLRDPFPANVIPADRIDPVTRRVLAYYPLPNANVGPFLRNNFFVNSAETNTPNGTVWKLDHNLGTRHRFSWNGRFSSGLNGAAPVFDNVANPGAPLRHVRSRSSGLNETFNISPTVVNQFHVSAVYSALAEEQSGGTIDYAGALGLTGVQPGVFPRFDLSSYVDIGAQPGSSVSYQMANYTVSDGLSIRYKKHNLKFDFSGYWGQVNSFLPRNPSGNFGFNGMLTSLPGINNTGNSFAQFLLGGAGRAEQSIVLNPSYLRNEQYQFTIGDEYQLTPNFTWHFSLGLQVDTPRREKFDRQSSIDLQKINPANGRPGALVFAGRDGHSRSFFPTQANWEPAVGWVLNPWGSRKTVVRCSYGLYFGYFPLYPTEFGTLGYNATPLIVSPNDQLAPAVTLATGFPADFTPPPNLQPTAANDVKAEYFDPTGTLPDYQSWRLEVERDLPGDFVIRLAYLGDKATHEYIGGGVELNPLDPQVLEFRDKLNDLDFNLSLRPYPQFRGISPGYAYPIGSSSVHRGNLRIEKRFSRGLNFSGSYVFSKSIDNVLARFTENAFSQPFVSTLDGVSPQNSLNLKAEKSTDPLDITHQVSINYLYELPFGEGRPFLNKGGLVNGFMGGWSLSGVTVFRSGTPIALKPLFNNTGRVAEALRVDVVPGIDPHVPNPSAFQWFNPSAFDQPPDFTLGDAPRTEPNLRNPGAQNFDMSLTKRFSVTQDWTLEVIMEAFNSFNHANWNTPDNLIGSKENPNLNAGKIVGSTGGRIIQLGLRFSF